MSKTAGGQSNRSSEPRHVRLPGFLVQEEVGLGDVIKRATHLAGVPACGGCLMRAERLNQAIVFTRR